MERRKGLSTGRGNKPSRLSQDSSPSAQPLNSQTNEYQQSSYIAPPSLAPLCSPHTTTYPVGLSEVPPSGSATVDPQEWNTQHGSEGPTQHRLAGYSSEQPPTVGTSKKTRHRDVMSCTQCRRRRSKCNRVYPCTECEKRGEAAQCDFSEASVAPAHASKRRNDSDLQAYAARLEAKIRDMQKILDSSSTSQGPATGGGGSSSSSSVNIPIGTSSGTRSVSGHQSVPASPQVSRHIGADVVDDDVPTAPQINIDIFAGDLAGHLSRLAISSAVGSSSQIAGEMQHPITPQGPMLSTSTGRILPCLPPDLLSRIPPSQVIYDLQRLLPSLQQARSSIQYFKDWLVMWHFIIDFATFEKEVADFWSLPTDLNTLSRMDLQWVAVYLGICGQGASLISANDCMQAGFVDPRNKDHLSASWISGAMRASVAGGLFTDPTINSIRCLCILSYRPDVDSIGSQFLVLTTAACLARELGIMCEPASSSPQAECDDRRSMAWCLAEYDWTFGLAMGNSWSIFHAQECNMALPGELPGSDYRSSPLESYQSTDPLLTSFRVRCWLARFANKLRFKKDHPPNYETVKQLEVELSRLEVALPDQLGLVLEGRSINPWPEHSVPTSISGLHTILTLCYLAVRLHQPFIAYDSGSPGSFLTSIDIDRHRRQTFKYGSLLLNIFHSGHFGVSFTMPYLFAINGAIACAVCILSVIRQGDAYEIELIHTMRTQLRSFLSNMASHAEQSNVLRRSTIILKSLLQRDEEISYTQQHHGRLAQPSAIATDLRRDIALFADSSTSSTRHGGPQRATPVQPHPTIHTLASRPTSYYLPGSDFPQTGSETSAMMDLPTLPPTPDMISSPGLVRTFDPLQAWYARVQQAVPTFTPAQEMGMSPQHPQQQGRPHQLQASNPSKGPDFYDYDPSRFTQN